jgi:2,4-dienoyl-CoA reductase (NADPH2)
MGSEGYLLTQFLVPRTNQRDDAWGGSLQNRQRFALEVVRRTRERVGADFILMYRLSVLDLIPDGADWAEIVATARALQGAGVTLFNTGVGWHEARVPTIAHMVPRGAFTFAAARLRGELSVPLIASNRIGTEPGESTSLTFYGSSFIADPTGAKVAEAGRTGETVLTATFDLDAVARQRRSWGVFRDRRPELYGALLTLDGRRPAAGAR